MFIKGNLKTVTKQRAFRMTYWHVSVILIFGRLRQDDHHEFEARLGDIVNPCLKTNQSKTNKAVKQQQQKEIYEVNRLEKHFSKS